ncbi:hypothetical protein AKJ08_0694 [Vulgatibacter incomptus]|uniref:Type IV fimbrial biogenesis protein FimT n=2 Tax=Vulgatibacter incomptus TaxID=1391653 RepID=A0A0K1P9Y1_9BACT|nr:hypothetical protein AKJ08_0694 [Vulgatibacter incomptus]
MLGFVLVGILVGLTVWQMQSFIVGGRIRAAAQELQARFGQAGAIAARINRAVDVIFTNSGSGCLPRYDVQSTDPETGDVTTYDSVCFATEYRGVQLSGGTVIAPPKCPTDPAPVPNCSLCTGQRIISFYPSGEVRTSDFDPAGDSLVVSGRDDPSPSRTYAVRIANLTGRTKVYRAKGDGSGWECP